MGTLRDSKQAENEIEMVYNAIEDYIFENHKFCSVDEFTEDIPLSTDKCRKILDDLAKSGRVSVVFKGRGKPTIYVPTYMMQEILRTQSKPRWVDNYTFEEKKESLKQITEAQAGVSHYETFERLLYATSTPLEEAVACALEYLGFPDVKHHKEEERQDVSFRCDTKKYLLEIEGTTKQGDVKKVDQLQRWVRGAVDEGFDPTEIKGILVVNHYRHLEPSERGDPLTQHAKRTLRLYHFNFFTTYFLFQNVKKVHEGSLSEDKAQALIVKGEAIS